MWHLLSIQPFSGRALVVTYSAMLRSGGWAARLGAKLLWLEVTNLNVAAIATTVRCGFRFVRSTPRSISVRMRRQKPLCLWPDPLSEVPTQGTQGAIPNIVIGGRVLYMANGLLYRNDGAERHRSAIFLAPYSGCPIWRATHLPHGTDIIDRQMIAIPGRQEFQRMGEALVMDPVGPGISFVDPTGFGCGNAFELTFLEQVGLKFGNPGQHRDEEFANRGGRVDHIPAHIQDDQRHPRLGQGRHGIESILRTAGKAVQFGDHDRVTHRE